MNPKKLSKFLSLVLRHKPEEIDLTLDHQGWTDVDHLLEQLATNRKKTTLEELQDMVASSEEQRFIFSEDGKKMRASSGHSIKIDLGLEPIEPPHILFHGTAVRFLKPIQIKGLRPIKSQHVHLSDDWEAAKKIGMRHGTPVVLAIEAGSMFKDGHTFYLNDEGIWLTESVPPGYLDRDL